MYIYIDRYMYIYIYIYIFILSDVECLVRVLVNHVHTGARSDAACAVFVCASQREKKENPRDCTVWRGLRVCIAGMFLCALLLPIVSQGIRFFGAV